MSALIAVVLITLFVSGMCSLLEATLFSTRVAALEAARSDKGRRRGAGLFLAMKRDVAAPTSAILILNTVANTAGATLAGMLAARHLGVSSVPAFSVGLTLAILFAAEILPKTAGAVYWRSLWPGLVWPLFAMQKALAPLVWITERFASLFVRAPSHSVATGEEIQAMIRLGAKSGEVSPTELELLTAVFHFEDAVARQIMVPRQDTVYFEQGWSVGRCIELSQRTRHTRYPLCKGSLDAVLGQVHTKDLLGVDLANPPALESLARPLRRIPETMPLPRLLREMQRTHHHMALVVDEYGTTVGIVTLENVLEQIVGSVQDEFDSEEPDIVPVGEGKYRIRGLTPLPRLRRALDLPLPSPPDVDTLSGLLVRALGRLPQVGDKVDVDGAWVEAVEVVGNRATRIEITLPAACDGAADQQLGE